MINIEEKINVNKSQEFSSKQMSIDPEFTNKIIWLVINQYKYKIRTSLQEIISNAIDAQVDANNTDRPLKISLPTKLEPTFKLRDYGTGMTPKVINKIYSSMGASGSSHTNDKKGGFGIGGKSPLGFCDQYTIRTIVNGTQWTYIVHKNELGGIDITPVGEESTNEENGTELIIPSSHDQISEFKKGAIRATYFWETQPIFNTDDLPKCPTPSLTLSDKIKVYGENTIDSNILEYNKWYSNLYILIDGIPYRVESSMLDKCSNLKKTMDRFKKGGIVTYSIGNGELKVLQTRESLEECKITYDKLEEIAKDINKELLNYVGNMKKPTLKETYQIYKKASGLFNNLPTLNFNSNIKLEPTGLYYFTGTLDKNTGAKINYLFNSVEYTYKSKRGRYYGKNTTARRINNNFARMSLDTLANFYLDDTPSESDQAKAKKCKYDISSTQGDIEYIKTDDMPKNLYNLLLNDLGLKVLSSLPSPPKAAKGASKTAKKLTNNLVDIHLVKSYKTYYWTNAKIVRQSKTVNLQNFTDKVLWIDYSEGCSQFENSQWLNYLESKGFVCAYVAKKYQNLIKNNNNFTNIKDFLKINTLSTVEKESTLYDKVVSHNYRIELMDFISQSNDTELKYLIKNIVKPVKSDCKLPQDLVKQFEVENKKLIDDTIKNLGKINKLIDKKYPLLKPDYPLEIALLYINTNYKKEKRSV